MFHRNRFHLPISHEPAMPVAPGGSCCANCGLFDASGGPYGTCRSGDYQRYYGTNLIPYDPNSYCSDWYVNSAAPTNEQAWQQIWSMYSRGV